jgi:predicted nucleotidyltransferase
MRDHHRRAIDKAKARLLGEPDVLAVLVGGSIAKGVEREASDVDLIVVTTDAGWGARRDSQAVAFLWRDLTDYEGGYVEGRYLSRSFVLAAAERGSEPTRHSFTGVFPIHCVDAEIEAALSRIPHYPDHDRQRRIDAFLAQLQLNRWFFWHEAKRRDDPYLRARAASDIVLFGARLILAHNHMLFPCQKRLLETLAGAPEKPDNVVQLAREFLNTLTDETMEAFCRSVTDFAPWSSCDLLSRFLADVEMSWFEGGAPIAEW